MTYQVAVPSYRRAAMLRDRTLPFLLSGGVPRDRITVFVHAHDDTDSYAEVCDAAGVNLRTTPVRGINAQRAAIRSSYPDGTELVQADDDITDVRRAVDKKTLAKI